MPKALLDELTAATRQSAPARGWISRHDYEDGEWVTTVNLERAIRRRTQHRRARALCDVESELREQLKNKTLIASGRSGSPLADAQLIPASAWSVLRFADWTKSIVKHGAEFAIFDVRISRQSRTTQRVQAVVKDVTACQAWLEKHILANPHRPIATKEKWRLAALNYWKSLSRRQFDKAWDRATEDAPAWRRSGNPISRLKDSVPTPP